MVYQKIELDHIYVITCVKNSIFKISQVPIRLFSTIWIKRPVNMVYYTCISFQKKICTVLEGKILSQIPRSVTTRQSGNTSSV